MMTLVNCPQRSFRKFEFVQENAKFTESPVWSTKPGRRQRRETVNPERLAAWGAPPTVTRDGGHETVGSHGHDSPAPPHPRTTHPPTTRSLPGKRISRLAGATAPWPTCVQVDACCGRFSPASGAPGTLVFIPDGTCRGAGAGLGQAPRSEWAQGAGPLPRRAALPGTPMTR